MGSSAIKGFCLLMMFHGCIVAGDISKEIEELERSKSYVCAYCCSKIYKQSAILSRISTTSDKLTKDVRAITNGITEGIPYQLEKQTEALDALKRAVSTDIPAHMERQSSGLKQIQTSVNDIAGDLKKHSEELIAHDERLKEQGQLLKQLTSLVKEIGGSLVGPKDCSDIRALGHINSGIYRVYPGSIAKRMQADVYCDMTTPGGNWLVFQRRKDGSVNFQRTWIEYLNGFGNPTGEFWLGNELLYQLTSNRKYKLRIDMEDFDGQKRYAEYSKFSISSSSDGYRLTASGYTGNAGDSLSGHSGVQFSTKDVDNDSYKEGSCSLLYKGAWWYTACHGSNLNGPYLGGPHKSYADGIEWYAFRGYYYSLKTTEMKIAVAD